MYFYCSLSYITLKKMVCFETIESLEGFINQNLLHFLSRKIFLCVKELICIQQCGQSGFVTDYIVLLDVCFTASTFGPVSISQH